MEKAKGSSSSSSGAQMKPAMPKHNMTVVELSTPHMKLPGVQKFTHEDLKLMVEKAKNFPQVQEGFYLAVQSYDFKVDEWELETGNSQPHSDESKLNLRPKTATLTAAERRNEQARKNKEVRDQMTKKLDGDRNPTFARPSTASNPVKQASKQQNEEKSKKKNADKSDIVEKTEEVQSEEEDQDNQQEEQQKEEEEEIVETKKPKSKPNSNPPRKEKKVDLKQEDVYEMDCDESNNNNKDQNEEEQDDENANNNKELNDSFEKMSVSQHADYLDNSRTSSKQGLGESSTLKVAATRQPKKNEESGVGSMLCNKGAWLCEDCR